MEASLSRVKGFRHQAEILEWQNTLKSLDEARARLTDAIDALPTDKSDGIEGAELYELRGRVQKKRCLLGEITSGPARRDYTNAEQLYARIGGTEAEPALERIKKDKDSLPPDKPPADGAGASPSE